MGNLKNYIVGYLYYIPPLQGLSTGDSTTMLDTNKLLADTLDPHHTYPTTPESALLPQRTRALRSEVGDSGSGAPPGVTDSVDSGMRSSAYLLRLFVNVVKPTE